MSQHTAVKSTFPTTGARIARNDAWPRAMFQKKPDAELRQFRTYRLPVRVIRCIEQKARESGISPHAWALKALDEACRGERAAQSG